METCPHLTVPRHVRVSFIRILHSVKFPILLLLFLVSFSSAMSQVKVDSARISSAKDTVTKGTSKADSLSHKFDSKFGSLSKFSLHGDAVTRKAAFKADSIRSEFKSKADSLQHHYRKSSLHAMSHLNKRRGHPIAIVLFLSCNKSS